MPKELSELAESGCPWLQHYSVAAYAAEAVVRLLDPAFGFASPEVRRLFGARAGFGLRLPPGLGRQVSDESRLLAALLAKLAQRGVPAPCSLDVERGTLRQAREAGVLDFEESSATGEYRFACRPGLPRLRPFLQVCLLPELLVPDSAVPLLLSRARSLCTEAESELFDRLVASLPDERLGLFWLPQRTLQSMAPLPPGSTLSGRERVDFALELPMLAGPGWLRLVLELDDETHTPAQRLQDRERDHCLSAAGWRVTRLDIRQQQRWEPVLRALSRHLETALPTVLREAARGLRALPEAQRKAVQNLVLLPVAEAQLLAALAQLLHRKGPGRVLVADPQGHGLGLVVDALAELAAQLQGLHGLAGLLTLEAAEPRDADLIYYAIPDAAAWDASGAGRAAVVAPRAVRPDHVPPLLQAAPHPVDATSLGRREGVQAGALHLLRNVFRKTDFRPGQLPIIEKALGLRPVVGLLPTGAGKSLCYQLAALCQPGFTLVIDPLRSLMLDQREGLESLGVHRCAAVLSRLSAPLVADQANLEATCRAVEQGHYLFVFVSPERLQIPSFRQRLRGFSAYLPVPFCVVDEAHCVSEWGHDFRPAYLNVARLAREYCTFQGRPPAVVALTGTASRNVLADILRELDVDEEAVVEPRSFDREELTFEVHRVRSGERLAQLSGRLRGLLGLAGWEPGQPQAPPSGLVFTNFATSRHVGVAAVSDELSRAGLPVGIHCGQRLPSWPGDDSDWERHKLETQRRFKRDQLPVLVCTTSFGMGVDKPTVRFTAHAMLPRSLEDFYQQAGRAGRDRSPARCLLFFADEQPGLTDRLLDTERTPLEALVARRTPWIEKQLNDGLRNLWFITANFRGRAIEKAVLRHMVSRLLPRRDPDNRKGVCAEVSFRSLPACILKGAADSVPSPTAPVGPAGKPADAGDEAEDAVLALEKALYRLLLVGAVVDYAKDYGRKQFEVTLGPADARHIYTRLESTLRRHAMEHELRQLVPSRREQDWEGAALACAGVLIDYVYDKIEKRRRRAIGQMLQVARDAALAPSAAEGDRRFREQLLAYLEESEFTQPIAVLTGRVEAEDWFGLLDQVEGADALVRLLGACRRRLEEAPDHPGLLLMAGLCRTASPHPDQGPQDVRSAFSVLRRLWPDPAQRAEVARRTAGQALRLAPSRLDAVLRAILEGDPAAEVVRCCYCSAPVYGSAHHLATRLLACGVLEALGREDFRS